MNNNTTDTLASLYNSKGNIEAEIKQLEEQINSYYDPDEINKQDEGTLILTNPDEKAKLKKEVKVLEEKKKNVEENIRQIEKEREETEDKELETVYDTQEEFSEDMTGKPKYFQKNMVLIGKSACKIAQQYENYMFIQFDLKNYSNDETGILENINDIIDTKNIQEQPIALFRNAQAYTHINSLVSFLARDQQKYKNLYLFEENFDNMLQFKNQFQGVYNNDDFKKHLPAYYLIKPEEPDTENECSITIKDPPLKKNNVGIGFVILLLVILLSLSFGFYKVLKRKKNVSLKKQKIGRKNT